MKLTTNLHLIPPFEYPTVKYTHLYNIFIACMSMFLLLTHGIVTLMKLLVPSMVISGFYLYYMSNEHNKKRESLTSEAKSFETEREIVLFRMKLQRDLTNFVLSHQKSPFSYDPENCESLSTFGPIKMGTECIFAKQSNVWGCNNWNPSLDLETNIMMSIPMLIKFFAVFRNPNKFLDGFVFEIVGDEYHDTIEAYANTVARVLKTVSDSDPSGFKCLEQANLEKIGWHFQYNSNPIFVTTFAPCYPKDHSRYSFGIKGSSFILLQPEESFEYHKLTSDTPITNWDVPVTERDRIRIAYKKNGREYEIPTSVFYAPAEHIVKPMKMGDAHVKWWEHLIKH